MNVKIKTPEEIKSLIKGRILDEFRKHPNLDWAEIAASKLYSQWNEFFEKEVEIKLILLDARIDELAKYVKKLEDIIQSN